MGKQILTLFFLFVKILSFGQTSIVRCEILSKQTTEIVLTEALRNQLGIIYPIRRVYKCIDKSGEFLIVLTESKDTIVAIKDSLHYNIKAFNFYQGKSGLLKKWEMSDFIIRQATNDNLETSIWFWTKYSDFRDIDNDGLIDPIVIYGTSGMNFTSDGRIRILIYYKGKKFAIRHQNGILDNERSTQIDKSFYFLPIAIQNHIKQIMKQMEDDGNIIFPYDWQIAMKLHKLYLNENSNK